MGGYHTFYEGGGYGKSAEYSSAFTEYRVPVSDIGQATDPRTANQLKAVSDRLNTGGKVIEVSPVLGAGGEILESIPNQHLEELNRLKKLAGAELTFHGPLIEASGFGRDAWSESKREQSERQMWSAVQRGHKMDPDGNLVITFHTTNGLPEMIERMPGAKGEKEKILSTHVIDERSGNIGPLPVKPNFFLKEESDPQKVIEKANKDQWDQKISNTSIQIHRGLQQIQQAREYLKSANVSDEFNVKNPFDIYKASSTPEGRKTLESLPEDSKKIAEDVSQQLNHADLSVRDAYNDLQNIYNEAYTAAMHNSKNGENKDLKMLEEFRDEMVQKINKENLHDKAKVEDLAEEVSKGLRVLSTLSQPPQTYRQLQEFAMDKSSDTFSNVAFKAYKEFGYGKSKDTTPIISLENPPAGQGFSRGEDIKQLVKKTREKFVEKAMVSTEKGGLGMDEEDAEMQAAKLIGVTWDVGHINMIRKFGYEDKDLLKETEAVAPYIKHVHLSDNFGLEHTELPMGMGNVPIKKHMELIDQYNKQAKKIVEVGNWMVHFNQRSALPETMAAFGSPIYGSAGAPYWNRSQGMSGGYFSGLGNNPDVHHSIYGAGFANLPVELGGQMAGRSRLSGAPIE